MAKPKRSATEQSRRMVELAKAAELDPDELRRLLRREAIRARLDKLKKKAA